MSETRDSLIRENFELERDFHYVMFREHQWNIPEIVKACPDEVLRDQMLRGFWNQDAENRYAEYRVAVADLSTSELLNIREEWVEKLDCLGMLEYREAVERPTRLPANDNEKGIDR
jgi:hypothetical protein